MADRIKGITIDIGGDTTKFTKSLKEVDSSLKHTQTQLKDVNKLLKLDPTNVTLLKQKHELLSKAVEDTEKKQKSLKKALQELDKAGVTEETREQYDALQRELIETEQNLKTLQTELGKSTPALATLGANAKQLSENTRQLSTVAGGAGVAMLGMAVNAGKTADDLLTLSRNTGFSVEELQKMQYASDLIDVSMEQMTGSIEKMTKQMASGNDTFATLGVSITDANGNMRDATDVWYETLEALSQVENGTLRDQYAMEIFGKSAMELSGIVDDGGEALRNLGTEAENAGLIMSEEGVQSAGEFNDALDKLKGTAQQAFFEAGASLADSLLPMLESLVTTVGEVLSWFGNLDGNTQMLILTILGLVASISPIAGLISAITTVAGALSVVTAPMAVTFMGIAGAIGVVIAIGTVLYQNWDRIKQAGIDLWNSVVSTWNGIKETISNAINGAKNAVSNAIDAIKGFFNFSWSLPHLKLPHFSITGSFSLNPPSIPHIGVSWYAKAMENGVILNNPTIFGAMNGKLLGGGEAGAEVVVGANSLYSMIQSAMGSQSITAPINLSVTVNGNVDDSDRFTKQLASNLANLITRNSEVFR